jgi:hypothetical protein
MSLIKRGRLCFLLLGFAFACTTAMGQIAIVNNGTPAHAKCAADGGCTTPGINTIGASIEFAACYSYGVNCTVSSTPSNTWRLVGGACYSGGSLHACLYQAYGPPSTGTAQTATFAGSYNGGFFLAFTGTPPDATAFDSISGFGASSPTTISPGSLTPAAPNELLISLVGGLYNAGSVTVDSGFSVLDSFPYSSGVYFGGAVAVLVDANTAPVNLTWTFPVPAAYGAATLVAGFKPAAVASKTCTLATMGAGPC